MLLYKHADVIEADSVADLGGVHRVHPDAPPSLGTKTKL